MADGSTTDDDENHINLQICWTDHKQVLTRVMSTLRYQELFADVTLVCGEKRYAAHKFVLCTCSPYFEQLLGSTPCDHPVLVLTETPPEAVEAMLDFMYLGQADLNSSVLDALLDVAYELRVRGLISPKDDPDIQEIRKKAQQKMFEEEAPVVKDVNVNASENVTVFRKIGDTKKDEELKLQTIVETAEEMFPQEETLDNLTEETPVSQENNEDEIDEDSESGETTDTAEAVELDSMSDGAKDYKCKHCEKTFQSTGLLKLHEVGSHVEENQFMSCPECPYRTLRFTAFQRHVGQHIKTKPFACPYCPARHSLEKYHVIHQRQAHPKSKVIINTCSRKNSKRANYAKLIMKPSQSRVTSLPSTPYSILTPSRSVSSPAPASQVCQGLRPTPSPSPTAKLLSSPKSSASSSPSSNVHQFGIMSPSPPLEMSRKRSNSSASPPAKLQKVGLSPSPSRRQPNNRSSSSSPVTPRKPTTIRRRVRRQQSMSPSQESSRSTCSSSCSSVKSPDYSPSPSPPPKILRSTRSNTVTQAVRRPSREN